VVVVDGALFGYKENRRVGVDRADGGHGRARVRSERPACPHPPRFPRCACRSLSRRAHWSRLFPWLAAAPSSRTRRALGVCSRWRRRRETRVAHNAFPASFDVVVVCSHRSIQHRATPDVVTYSPCRMGLSHATRTIRVRRPYT
jgi:hypothetical protein